MEDKELLEEEYGFTIKGTRESGAGHVLETNQGLFYLYTAPAGYKYKSKWIERVKKHISQQQEIGMLKLVKTQGGHGFISHDEQMYYLYRGIREAKLADPYFACGQSLAHFHKATSTFTGDKLFLPYSSLGGWPSMWRRRLRHYDEYRDELDDLKTELTPMDEYLLTCHTYVHQLGETAVQYLHTAGYDKVVKETASFGKVAYQNFDQGYMLWNEKNIRLMSGEWNWVLDMRARDIGQWLKAESRRNGWQDETAIRFIEGYNSVSPLLDSEYAIIYGLMLYPGRFLKLVESYQELPREERLEVNAEAWHSHLEDELVHMETALRRYPLVIEQQYGTSIPHIEWLWRLEDEETHRSRDEENSE
jgi:spore coat protein YutH